MNHPSWQWRLHIARCKLFLTQRRAELAVLAQLFLLLLYTWGSKKNKYGFFSPLIPYPQKKAKQVDPWQFPKYMDRSPYFENPLLCPDHMSTGLEELALNACNFQNIYFKWDSYIWNSSEGLPGPQKWSVFTHIQLFSWLWSEHTRQKTHSFWSSIVSRAMCRKKRILGGAVLY